MPLSVVQVREDWRDRARIVRQKERQALRRTLFLVLVTVFLVGGIAFSEVDRFARAYIMEAVTGMLYLITGVMLLQGMKPQRGRLTLFGSLLLVSGMLINIVLTLRRSEEVVLPFVLRGAVPVVLGWLFLLASAWGAKQWPSTQNSILPTVGWGLVGGMAGGIAVLVWSLSASFSAQFFTLPLLTPLFWQRFLVNVGLLAVGEEFLFRRVLFHLLYRRFDMDFWPATIVTLFANSAFYAVQIVFLFTAPDRAILFLLGPLLIVIINCALYALEGGLLSPLVSHVVFRAASLILGLAAMGF